MSQSGSSRRLSHPLCKITSDGGWSCRLGVSLISHNAHTPYCCSFFLFFLPLVLGLPRHCFLFVACFLCYPSKLDRLPSFLLCAWENTGSVLDKDICLELRTRGIHGNTNKEGRIQLSFSLAKATKEAQWLFCCSAFEFPTTNRENLALVKPTFIRRISDRKPMPLSALVRNTQHT